MLDFCFALKQIIDFLCNRLGEQYSYQIYLSFSESGFYVYDTENLEYQVWFSNKDQYQLKQPCTRHQVILSDTAKEFLSQITNYQLVECDKCGTSATILE